MDMRGVSKKEVVVHFFISLFCFEEAKFFINLVKVIVMYFCVIG